VTLHTGVRERGRILTLVVILAEVPGGRISVQCDVCVPPVLTVGSPAQLARLGWSLRSAGQPVDACLNCTAHLAPRQRVPRADAVPSTPDPERMPNVIVIGAMKAGTTSMHNYLDVHPDVAVSAEKEMRFFSDPRALDWLGRYQEHFPAGTRYRVESSPHYTKLPVVPGVVDRMADLVPDARLIYLVRDPVERIVAEYVEQVQWHAAYGTLEEELADAADPANALVASSRYATQLEEFLRRYPREQVLVLDLADLGTDVVGTMARVFSFLDLDAPTASAEDYGRHNTREEKYQVPGWLLRLRRGPLLRAFRRLPAGPRRMISMAAWRRSGNLVERPTLTPETEARLHAALRPEMTRFAAATGIDFTAAE